MHCSSKNLGEKHRHVLHVGDVTDRNRSGEWDIARLPADSMLELAKVPYTVIPGYDCNHPRSIHHPEITISSTRLSSITSRVEQPCLGQRTEFSTQPHYENNATTFKAADRKFLVIGLEYAPTKDALCWADRLARQHWDHWVIVLTHCYMKSDAALGSCGGKTMLGSNGETIWNELLRRNPNIMMIINGHVTESEFQITSRPERPTWSPVLEMLVDYQHEPDEEGGHWLLGRRSKIWRWMASGAQLSPDRRSRGNPRLVRNGSSHLERDRQIRVYLRARDGQISSLPQVWPLDSAGRVPTTRAQA